MKDLVHSAALWIILGSLVFFVSRTEAQNQYSQQVNTCRSQFDLSDISTYFCSKTRAVPAKVVAIKD